MKIIIFDTETTGLPKQDAPLEDQPHIIQFASLTYDFDPLTKRFTESARYNQLIKPPVAIPAESTRVTGITDESVSGMPVFAAAYNDIAALFQEADVAVAHNIEFDRLMLANEIKRLGKTGDLMPGEIYDSMEQTRDLCKLPGRSGGYKAPRLMELHQFLLNESFQEAHNAIKDVEALARCVKVLLQQGFYNPKPSSKTAAPVVAQAEQASLF
jgi:DNA polymerase III epsilon subunit-like protein